MPLDDPVIGVEPANVPLIAAASIVRLIAPAQLSLAGAGAGIVNALELASVSVGVELNWIVAVTELALVAVMVPIAKVAVLFPVVMVTPVVEPVPPMVHAPVFTDATIVVFVVASAVLPY